MNKNNKMTLAKLKPLRIKALQAHIKKKFDTSISESALIEVREQNPTIYQIPYINHIYPHEIQYKNSTHQHFAVVTYEEVAEWGGLVMEYHKWQSRLAPASQFGYWNTPKNRAKFLSLDCEESGQKIDDIMFLIYQVEFINKLVKKPRPQFSGLTLDDVNEHVIQKATPLELRR